MLRWMGRITGGLLLTAVVAIGVDALTYSPRAWTADYERLKRDMAQSYANLDWMVHRRRLDLVALDQRTTERLRSAHSRVRAYLALTDFIAAFRDPHVEIAWHAPGGGTRSQVGADKACMAAGGGAPAAFHPALAALPGWTPLPSAHFATALQGDTAFLRIASFSERSYPEACRTVGGPDRDDRALQLATRAALQDQLRASLAQFRQRGAARLVIDLTGNGGGSEWATEAASLFSAGPLRRRERLLVGPQCDRSAVWRGDPPPCSVFRAPASEFTETPGTGAWNGQLFILADGGTASAAEDFIVWLHGSGAATLIGERTPGAGCG